MWTRLSLCLVLALFLVSCSDDSNGPDDGGFTPQREFYGLFLDDAVQGLEVRGEDDVVHITDQFGAFVFELDEVLTFLVDGVELGSIDSPRTRVTPFNLGAGGTNVARLLQSLDTTPGQPGIDLTGIDLADTPIDFTQSTGSFGTDPAVQQALIASMAAGGSGVLISAGAASAAVTAATSSNMVTEDLENVAMYPITPGEVNEPCFVRLRDDGTGESICRDDLLEDPTASNAGFSWSITDFEAILEFPGESGIEERLTFSQLGRAGNRISIQYASECLTCNPAVEPTIEAGVQTLLLGLPLSANDLAGQSLDFVGTPGTITVNFVAGGGGTLSRNAFVQNILWSVGDEVQNVVRLRGSGTPGSRLPLHEMILVNGGPSNGEFAILLGSAIDADNSGVADPNELDASGIFEAVALMISTGD